MTKKVEPNWQPISALPMVATFIDGMLDDTEKQYQALLPVKEKPYVLDDHTVGRVIKVFTDQKNDLWLWEKQLYKWEKLNLTRDQRQEVGRLNQQMVRVREVTESILTLAEELKENTIEKLMAKDDAQLGLEFLLGKLK
jgi:hypothetical protein